MQWVFTLDSVVISQSVLAIRGIFIVIVTLYFCMFSGEGVKNKVLADFSVRKIHYVSEN